MGLGRYIARRTVYTIVLLVVIVIFNFFLFQIMPFIFACPGMTYNRCVQLLYVPQQPPKGATDPLLALHHEQEIIMAAYGFNRSIPERFVLYFKDMFTFQFGFNIHGVLGGSVLDSINKRLPFTVLLLGASTVASFIIGIGLGVVAAAKRGKIFDVSSLATLLFVNALPVFFLAGMLELSQLALTGTFYQPVGAALLSKIGWAYDAAILKELFLPFVTLTLAGIGGVFLTQRAVMIDTMAEDYILMARAKGVPERTVLYTHALRNAVLPIATAFALSIGFILSGAIITETVFGWPGLGQAIYLGVEGIDFPLEQAMFFIISIMVLIAIFVADIMYGFLDPRVSTG